MENIHCNQRFLFLHKICILKCADIAKIWLFVKKYLTNKHNDGIDKYSVLLEVKAAKTRLRRKYIDTKITHFHAIWADQNTKEKKKAKSIGF